MKMGDKLNQIFELRARKAELNDEIKSINREIERLEFELIKEMDEQGLERLQTETGSATRSVALYPKVEDKEAFVNWCVENARLDMLVAQANRGSFREYFEENNEYPEGVDAYEKASLNYRTRRR